MAARSGSGSSSFVQYTLVMPQRCRPSCLAAHLILVLRMCAELTTAEQDEETYAAIHGPELDVLTVGTNPCEKRMRVHDLVRPIGPPDAQHVCRGAPR